MDSIMHKSLPNTVDYWKFLAQSRRDQTLLRTLCLELYRFGPDYPLRRWPNDWRLFQSENRRRRRGCPLIAFYHEALEEIRGEVIALGGRITRDIFDFPGGRRFHFADPGEGEFAIWSDQ